MTRTGFLPLCTAVLLAVSLVSTADAALYLLFNVGDGEDREVKVAAKSIEAAMKGSRPAKIDSNAERYFIHLPHSTMETLSGAATRVGHASTKNQAAEMVSSVSETADAGVAAEDSEGDTGWIEYEASAASLMLFSPDGLDEESDIRFEPARVFLRRFDDGSVYAMITGQEGTPP